MQSYWVLRGGLQKRSLQPLRVRVRLFLHVFERAIVLRGLFVGLDVQCADQPRGAGGSDLRGGWGMRAGLQSNLTVRTELPEWK